MGWSRIGNVYQTQDFRAAEFTYADCLHREVIRSLLNAHFRMSENLCNEFYLHAGSKRDLSNPEGAANVCPYVAKYVCKKF